MTKLHASVIRDFSTSKGTGKVQSFETCAVSNTSDNFLRGFCLQVSVYIHSIYFRMKLDTAAGGNFISKEILKEIGDSDLQTITGTL